MVENLLEFSFNYDTHAISTSPLHNPCDFSYIAQLGKVPNSAVKCRSRNLDIGLPKNARNNEESTTGSPAPTASSGEIIA